MYLDLDTYRRLRSALEIELNVFILFEAAI